MLEKIGAGEGNRTLVISLEGFCSTIELHPRRAPRRVARIQHLGLGQNTAAPADDIIEKNIGNAPLCAGARVRGTPCDLIHSGVALDALHAGIYRREVNWVLDADIQGFFDAMAHSWIIRFLEQRIADKRILRLVPNCPKQFKLSS
jgi:hypothetical protein